MDTETADALIERLPPDWEKLATKSDLGRLETVVETKIGALGTELRDQMATLRTDVSRDLRVVMFTIVGFALAVVGMFATILVSGVPAAG